MNYALLMFKVWFAYQQGLTDFLVHETYSVFAGFQPENAMLVGSIVQHDKPLVSEERRYIAHFDAVCIEHLSRMVHKPHDFVDLHRIGHLIAHGDILEQGADGVHR